MLSLVMATTTRSNTINIRLVDQPIVRSISLTNYNIDESTRIAINITEINNRSSLNGDLFYNCSNNIYGYTTFSLTNLGFTEIGIGDSRINSNCRLQTNSYVNGTVRLSLAIISYSRGDIN